MFSQFILPVGRAGRLQWWFGFIIQVVLFYGPFLLLADLSDSSEDVVDTLSSLDMILILLALVLAVWIYFCQTVKRYHDRDKSGWWYLIGLIPILGLWQIIECGFLSGTPGGNSYGPDRHAVDLEQMRRELAGQRDVPRERAGTRRSSNRQNSKTAPEAKSGKGSGKVVFGRRGLS